MTPKRRLAAFVFIFAAISSIEYAVGQVLPRDKFKMVAFDGLELDSPGGVEVLGVKYGGMPEFRRDENSQEVGSYCYIAQDGSEAIFETFTSDHINSVQVRRSAPEVDREWCYPARLKSFAEMDANGLRLSMRRDQVEALLGGPGLTRDGVTTYEDYYTRPLTLEEQEIVRKNRWHYDGFDYSKLEAEESTIIQFEYQDSMTSSYYISRFTSL